MTPKQQAYEVTASTIIKNLAKRRMEGFYCPDSKSAVAKALELMPKGCSIAWGGSATVQQTDYRQGRGEDAGRKARHVQPHRHG